MPKMKTKRAVAKRFRVTGSGKLMHKRQAQTHLAAGKSSRRMRRLGRDGLISGQDERRMKRLIGPG